MNEEPIGQHYLRTMVIALKFELGLCVAAVVALPGTFVLGLLGRVRWWLMVACGAEGLAAFGLLLQANDCMENLAEVRGKLVEHYRHLRASDVLAFAACTPRGRAELRPVAIWPLLLQPRRLSIALANRPGRSR